MRKVRHPSLVELLDAGELPEGGAYIAMARVHENCLENFRRLSAR